jgi:hypothetical protein
VEKDAARRLPPVAQGVKGIVLGKDAALTPAQFLNLSELSPSFLVRRSDAERLHLAVEMAALEA